MGEPTATGAPPADDGPGARRGTRGRGGAGGSTGVGPRVVVATTAVAIAAVRLAVILTTGPTGRGLDSDESIYLTAGLALGRGALPYRDVTVAQPPGLFLLLAPLGRLGSVLDALTVARVATALAGAAGVYLIGRIALRGHSTVAAVAAMVIAATLPTVAVVERQVVIEPWLNLFTLLAAAAWLGEGADAPARRREWGAGVALGCALACKLWALGLVVPMLATRGRRSWHALGRVAGGAAATLAVTVVPFVVAAPGDFVDQVVRYQSGRTDGPPLTDRLRGVFGLGWDQLAWREAVPTLVAALAIALLCTRRRHDQVLRFGVAWYLATVASFLLGPYFGFNYGAALAPAVGLMATVVVDEAVRAVTTAQPRARLAGVAALTLLAVGLANDLRWVRGDALGTVPTSTAFAGSVRREPGTVWSPWPERILVGDRLPATDGTGRVRFDPFVATAPAGARSDGTTAALVALDRSDLVVTGSDDRRLGTELARRGFERIRSDAASGRSLWRRPG